MLFPFLVPADYPDALSAVSARSWLSKDSFCCICMMPAGFNPVTLLFVVDKTDALRCKTPDDA